jgi:hypothetical protein
VKRPQEAGNLYRLGFSVEEIALKMSIADGTVVNYLRWDGIEIKFPCQTRWDERLSSKWRLSKWQKILPPDVAKKQAQWEVYQAIVRVRAAGVTQKQIALWLGVSHARIGQYERQAARLKIAPIEAYFNLSDVLAALFDGIETSFTRSPGAKVADGVPSVLGSGHQPIISSSS